MKKSLHGLDRLAFLPWLLGGMFFLLAVYTYHLDRSSRLAQEHFFFEKTAATAVQKLQANYKNYLQALHALNAFLNSSRDVTPEEWSDFVRSLMTVKTHSEVLGFGFFEETPRSFRLKWWEGETAFRPPASFFPKSGHFGEILLSPWKDDLCILALKRSRASPPILPGGTPGKGGFLFLVHRPVQLLQEIQTNFPGNPTLRLSVTQNDATKLLARIGNFSKEERGTFSFSIGILSLRLVISPAFRGGFSHQAAHGLFFLGVLLSLAVFFLSRQELKLRRQLAQNAEKLAEAYLQTEKDYRALLEQTASGVVVTDLTGRPLDANEKALELLNIARKDFLQKKCSDFFAPSGGENPADRLHTLSEGQELFLETELSACGGEKIPVEIHSRRLPQNRVLCILNDIRERKAAEAALRASEERYRRLVEWLPDGVLVHREGKILYANTAALRLFAAASLEEMQNTSLEKIVHPESRKLVFERIARQERGEILPPAEQKLVRLDGKFFEAEGNALSIFFEGAPANLAVIRDVSIRKKTEHALALERRRLEQILSSLPLMLWTIGLDRRIQHLQGKGFEEAGIETEKLIGQDAFKVFEDYPALLSLGKRAFEGFSFQTQTRIHGKDYESWIAPIQNEKGLVEGILILCANITERLETQKRLEEQERFLRTMLSQLPGMVYRCRNIEERVVEFASDGAMELLGCSSRELLQQPLGPRIHPQDRKRVHTEIESALRREHSFTVHYRLQDAKGRWRWVADRGRCVKGRDPQDAVLEGFLTDITEKQQAEEELRQLALQLSLHAPAAEDQKETERFFQLSPDLFGVFDKRGRLLHMNPSWKSALGYASQDVLYRSIRPLIHPEDRKRVFLTVKRVFLQNTSDSLEFRCRTKNGTYRWLLWSVSTNPKEGVLYAVGRDITERKITEHHLLDLAERLQQSNQELESFSYSVSHDLRAPLSALFSYSRSLLKSEKNRLSTQGRRDLGRIVELCGKMDQLIQSLLQLGRAGRRPLEVRNFSMQELVQSIAHHLYSLEPQNRKIVLSLGRLPDAWGDPDLIRQVWENVIANALKFTRKQEETRITVGGQQEGDKILYWVKDNGVGLPAESLPLLFKPFQRLHNGEAFEGHGVGLALAQKIIQRHGGRLWGENNPSGGAAFYFTLPAL